MLFWPATYPPAPLAIATTAAWVRGTDPFGTSSTASPVATIFAESLAPVPVPEPACGDGVDGVDAGIVVGAAALVAFLLWSTAPPCVRWDRARLFVKLVGGGCATSRSETFERLEPVP